MLSRISAMAGTPWSRPFSAPAPRRTLSIPPSASLISSAGCWRRRALCFVRSRLFGIHPEANQGRDPALPQHDVHNALGHPVGHHDPWHRFCAADHATHRARFDPNSERFALTVTLTRYMFPFMLFICLAALITGVLNAFHSFFLPALAPAP